MDYIRRYVRNDSDKYFFQDFTGETDLDRLIAKFSKQDEENYALFNYVNEANHELETLSNNVAELKIKIGGHICLWGLTSGKVVRTYVECCLLA